MRGEEKIKMPDIEKIGEPGLTFPGRTIKNTYYSEGENKTTIGVCYNSYEKSDFNIKKISYTSLTDMDNDGYADMLEMSATDDETPYKDISIDLNRYKGYAQIRWDNSSTSIFSASE